MSFIKKLFCKHTYTRSFSWKSYRVGNHKHVYDYENYKCEKCNHSFSIKTIKSINKNYYLNNKNK